jgi:hypothetical protein
MKIRGRVPIYCYDSPVLFLQVLGNVNAERTLAEVYKPEGKREWACRRIFIEAFEKRFYANVPCPAQIFKA